MNIRDVAAQVMSKPDQEGLIVRNVISRDDTGARKIILRAPASSLLMTFLTIKPSWSGLVMTSAAASRTFLISTILLSQSVAYRHKNSMLRTGNLFDTIGQEGILERSRRRPFSP